MSEWITWEQHGGAFPNLQELRLSRCPKLEDALPGELPSLMKLEIEGCDQLVATFPRARAMVEVTFKDESREVKLDLKSGLSLSGINYSYLDQLLGDIQQTLGERIVDLKQVSIGSCDLAAGYHGTEACRPLEGVLEHFKWLDSLVIQNCPKVVCFPKCELASPTLTKLRLAFLEKLESLPVQMKSALPCLVKLVLTGCPELESFPAGGLPSKLQVLQIRNCKKLMQGRKRWNLLALPSLSSLEVGGGGYSLDENESFPEAFLLPPTLTTLSIHGLDGLRSIDHKGILHLTSLQTLVIVYCNSLEKLLTEEEGLPLPQSLTALKIINLPNLKSLRSPLIERLTSLRRLIIMACDKVFSYEVALPLHHHLSWGTKNEGEITRWVGSSTPYLP